VASLSALRPPASIFTPRILRKVAIQVSLLVYVRTYVRLSAAWGSVFLVALSSLLGLSAGGIHPVCVLIGSAEDLGSRVPRLS
jgi:hypothetical protein